MTTTAAPLTSGTFQEVGVYGVDEPEAAVAFYRANGFVTLRGIHDEAAMRELVAAGLEVQRAVAEGRLDDRYGTTTLVDDVSGARTAAFPNYVTHVTEVSDVIARAVADEHVRSVAGMLIGDECWLRQDDLFGVVYQDARAGRESSYSRIGWHSDWQSGPHLDRWPSVAFTIHLDATSPENGFLRVVPGSHLWQTPAPYRNANGVRVPANAKPTGGYTDTPAPFEMPLAFGKVPGEIAVYCESGDVLLHDAYLWHSAARATDDEGIRRHIRGGFYSGTPHTGLTEADFIKNAAR